MIDTFTIYASSTVSAITASRSIFAATFPLFSCTCTTLWTRARVIVCSVSAPWRAAAFHRSSGFTAKDCARISSFRPSAGG
ncbi:uncharacterized protein BCR38DRAFT_452253 [Pseudomassariella vexata]|uniref:Uncharacterized protein n=1 Tax=Pseudomassariella vexata TaxID=1141098 RepID=A0A1Y2DAM5_9PEZI|nr:uncharacterized protein BCR38DRAFT_452253 [Pseudomassariella vexata]ORY55715.1 hypothetical protein BCR38DRAFT_452253 [Pseudomassariella vexata]